MVSARPQFVLASASPARRGLLVAAGISPFVCPSGFDESQVPYTDPATYVTTLAHSKATAVAPQFPDSLVLGCDSVLAMNGQVYGKPADPAEAMARWRQMRGQQGELFTGHALIPPGGPPLTRCAVTQVTFADIDEATIAAYVATGEPLACAGAFAIDGCGGMLVDKLDGCHSNVIGLSLPLLRTMLEQVGYPITRFW